MTMRSRYLDSRTKPRQSFKSTIAHRVYDAITMALSKTMAVHNDDGLSIRRWPIEDGQREWPWPHETTVGVRNDEGLSQ